MMPRMSAAGRGRELPELQQPSTAAAERGRAERADVPLDTHGQWVFGPQRPDPLDILRAQNADRIQELLPIRWSRMAESPFAYLRGAAAVMASDLAPLPRTDLFVQLCGDAHIGNFGGFATAERNLVFDVNDFDETLVGPFEWDVRRLAASVVLAGENLADGADGKSAAKKAAKATVRSYRKWMNRYATMTTIARWYERIDAQDAAKAMPSAPAASRQRIVRKARKRTSERLLPKLSTLTADGRRIVAKPPLILPLRDPAFRQTIESLVRSYLESVPAELRFLLAHYRFVDVAQKVVGVGSVGTRCLILLLLGPDDDPIFLQMKEASAPVLGHLLEQSPATPTWPSEGERVVRGQRQLQAAGDPFLGWGSANGRDYYARQLQDMKLSLNLSKLTSDTLGEFGALCARALARAHARSGDAVAIDAYLGTDTTFEKAVARGAVEYARITKSDHAQLVDAIASGVLPKADDVDEPASHR
jgi:uncharacterized protein (DUF2252 family)